MSARISPAVSLGALGMVIAGLLFASCKETDDTRGGPRLSPSGAAQAPACNCDDELVVDATLLAFLSKARIAHHNADVALEAKDRAAAITVLESVVKSPWSGKKPPEMIEVQADTLARLGDIKSDDGKFDDAARDVDAGIAMAEEPTYFRGHLFEIRGLIEKRRADALKDKGDAAGEGRATKAALDAFDKAMKIQNDVIDRAIKEKEREKRGKDQGGTK
jgi:hypothetical protein